MPNQKLEKLKQLSPLASAIAFSMVAPSQLLAEAFNVANQAELDTAISAIDGSEGDTHSITFTAAASGQDLNWTSLSIYEGTNLTIDGSSASDLELTISDGGGSAIYLSDSDVTINNVSFLIEREGEGSFSDAFVAYDNSSLSVNNTDITIAEGDQATTSFYALSAYSDSSLSADYLNITSRGDGEVIGIGVWSNSDLSISNSSFEDLVGQYAVAFWANNSVGNNVSVSISDSSFANNESNKVLKIAPYYNDGHVDATLSGLSFTNNQSEEGDVLSLYSYSSHTGDMDVTLVNSTFSRNKVGGNLLRVSSNAESDSSSLNVQMANITMADNEVGGSAIYSTSYGNESVLNLDVAHVTLVQNSALENYSSNAAFEVYLDDSNDNVLNVNMVNSIIAGNTRSQYVHRALSRSETEVESTPEVINSDVRANTAININHSLIGAEETDSESMIVGANNITGEDPKLGPLEKKGGNTSTMKPLKGSPVINAGDGNFAESLGLDITLATDQRGKRRVIGSAPDMGAVEKTNKPESDGFFGSLGLGSLLASFAMLGFRRKRK